MGVVVGGRDDHDHLPGASQLEHPHRVAHHLPAADAVQRLGNARPHPLAFASRHYDACYAHIRNLRRLRVCRPPPVDYTGVCPNCDFCDWDDEQDFRLCPLRVLCALGVG